MEHTHDFKKWMEKLMSARYILNKGFVVYPYLKLFETSKGSENDMRRVDSHEFFLQPLEPCILNIC